MPKHNVPAQLNFIGKMFMNYGSTCYFNLVKPYQKKFTTPYPDPAGAPIPYPSVSSSLNSDSF